MSLETSEGIIEESLEAWEQGAALLESLPSLSPDHETVRLKVVQLRDVYESVISRRQQGAAALAALRATIEDATGTISAVRTRLSQSQSRTSGQVGPDYVQRTINQAVQLLGMMEPYSAEYDRISSAIRELEQIEAMITSESGDVQSERWVQRAIVEAQHAIAEAGRTRPRTPRTPQASGSQA